MWFIFSGVTGVVGSFRKTGTDVNLCKKKKLGESSDGWKGQPGCSVLLPWRVNSDSTVRVWCRCDLVDIISLAAQ